MILQVYNDGLGGSISLWNDRRGFGATTGGLPLPGGSMGKSEMLPFFEIP